MKPIVTDELLRTLNTTNENIAAISSDLKKITQKINNSASLWKLLSDTAITRDIKQAALNIKAASYNAAIDGKRWPEQASVLTDHIKWKDEEQCTGQYKQSQLYIINFLCTHIN